MNRGCRKIWNLWNNLSLNVIWEIIPMLKSTLWVWNDYILQVWIILAHLHLIIIRQPRLHFVNEGYIEEIYSKIITKSYNLRWKADYTTDKPGEEMTESVLNDAESFVDWTKSLRDFVAHLASLDERIKRAIGEFYEWRKCHKWICKFLKIKKWE